MTKLEFMELMNTKLRPLPEKDVRNSLSYYDEMIDDCIESGMSEEDAVLSMGDPTYIAGQILEAIAEKGVCAELPKRQKRKSVLEIVLLVLGSPIWLSLLIAALAVILSLVVAALAVVWSVGASFAGGFLAALVLAVQMFMYGVVAQGIFCIGASAFLAGLAVLMYFVSLQTTKLCVKMVKKLYRYGRSQIRKGENEYV